jgi:hypothetical protein
MREDSSAARPADYLKVIASMLPKDLNVKVSEDNRRVSNGEQYLMAANAALNLPVSRQWSGYWHRYS